ncbi:acetyltransferase [Exophiala xenobiotica]|nr:acetyltransferase [Exophiala xenobiotica]KAK5208604.1 Peroxygenase 1 [Exophiala xenobiotica]KAK5229934.1 Peroxygenase 1 [Exophiala xenobiotica]KAK5234773.1 Peroxygenase 1 [Exophiala xenobiotica]KAK5247892.1 Peroxygenase 1 [Exophiala xenobiotica]
MAEINTSSYTIRYATSADVPVILQLIQELASYEKALHEVLATEQSLRATLSFPEASAPGGFTRGYAKTLLILPNNTSSTSTSSEGGASSSTNNAGATAAAEDKVEDKVEVAGMALFFHNYSTWTSAPGIYLEDLFVRPAYRGTGFGGALIQALARECVSLGCKRLDWSVLKWNEPSIKFYEGGNIGAKRMDEWMGMRVDGERLEDLARKGLGEA